MRVAAPWTESVGPDPSPSSWPPRGSRTGRDGWGLSETEMEVEGRKGGREGWTEGGRREGDRDREDYPPPILLCVRSLVL